MDPKRWEKIERLFQRVLATDEDHRAAILEQSCADDDSLRHEVESLLRNHNQAKSFIENPAFATATATGPQSAPARRRLANTTIAHYRVLEEIGGGGMGVVYRAEDTKLGRVVALKFLPDHRVADISALERFHREARAASALNHPNICTIYDIEDYEDEQFIAMEYIEGKTVADLIAGHPLELEAVAKIGMQAAEGLAAAHSKGIIHRDIKPSNIIVTPSGLAKVLDFGLAKLLQSDSHSGSTANITQTGAISGTLPYMSPEQLRGRKIDAGTDIYAIGVVLYEMATGQRPFTAEITPQLIDDILNNPAPLPRQVNPKISPKLEEIILKFLAKDPQDRYQTAKEIAVDLRRMTSPTSVFERSVTARPKRFGKDARILWPVIPILVFAILVVGWVYRATSFNATRSIAVLPFEDEGNDPSNQYVADGITEGLIDELSEIPSLRVISRNSVFKFKGKDADAQAVGRKLNVQAVLTGRIAHHADGVRISAELVNVFDGSQIWGRQFLYSISDLPRAQDEMTGAILEKLKLRLNSAEKNRLSKPATVNSEAYQLYLQGRFHWNQRTEAGIRKSVELFQQALVKDPNFALAYAGLADAYNMGNNLGVFTPSKSSPEAKAAAIKALVLDPRLAEAHAALGQVMSHYDFDFPGAQREYLKAIELNPSYATAHNSYAGGYLTPMGRHAEAIAEMKKALELDPLSSALNNYMGETYLFAGDYQKSAQQFQHTIDLDPTFPLAHFFFSDCLIELGEYEQAIEETQKGRLLDGQNPEQVAARAAEFRRAFRTRGHKGYWQKNLEARLKKHDQGGSEALDLAGAYARVGNKEKALEWLQKAYEEKVGNISLVNSYPNFKNLHGDPRYSALLKRIGVPD